MTGHIEAYIMVAMGSYRNNGTIQQFNDELFRLSKGFKNLNITHKKGVLKTARGLLQIQRTHKEMIAAGAEYSVLPAQYKK